MWDVGVGLPVKMLSTLGKANFDTLARARANASWDVVRFPSTVLDTGQGQHVLELCVVVWIVRVLSSRTRRQTDGDSQVIRKMLSHVKPRPSTFLHTNVPRPLILRSQLSGILGPPASESFLSSVG